MARYKAKWIYSPCCLRKGEVKAECEGKTLSEFAHNLCTTYAYELGDGFSFARYESEKQIIDFYGGEENLPDWFVNITTYPVLVFWNNFGEETLCDPTATAIINQIAGESYGDYNLTITGV